MIKTSTEMRRHIEKQIKEANELAKVLEKLKAESMDNGGENIKLITADLCTLYCWKERLTITMNTNKILGKDTSYTPTTPVTAIIESAVYMPKL
jgi:predicted nuclease with TOPRIM domain